MRSMVYPFSHENEAWLKRLSEKEDMFEIRYLVAPRSWNTNKVFGTLQLTENFDEAISDTDTLIVPDSSRVRYLYKDILKKIDAALNNGKKVYCCIELKDDDLARLEKAANGSGDLVYLNARRNKCDVQPNPHDTLVKQEHIVVAIAPMIRGMELSSVLCRLADEYEQQGYSVAMVSDNTNCELLSEHYLIPEGILSHDLTGTERVIAFNRFIKTVEDRSKADITLVCFTDGIIGYSDDYFGDFGIAAYEQSRALNIDYFILCALPEFISYDPKGSIEELKNICKYHLGTELMSVIIDDISVDEEGILINDHDMFSKVDPVSVRQLVSYIKNTDTDVYVCCRNDPDAYTDIANDCIENLSSQIDVF